MGENVVIMLFTLSKSNDTSIKSTHTVKNTYFDPNFNLHF